MNDGDLTGCEWCEVWFIAQDCEPCCSDTCFVDYLDHEVEWYTEDTIVDLRGF